MRGLGEVGECMSVCCNIAERENFYGKILLIYISPSSWLCTTSRHFTSCVSLHFLQITRSS